ncbi:hypothetical protein BLNAU_3247 [Blattamonas nauphoetae]|uniref:Uncharacterized protein n=1 Tax=Blattamonas nauphoetae TaxID=2049346 RepID=A0ABQ9YDG5_9EUKA|nr:hypothetical protein BLNAU_3247 [Blattamonas nauphoetae]
MDALWVKVGSGGEGANSAGVGQPDGKSENREKISQVRCGKDSGNEFGGDKGPSRMSFSLLLCTLFGFDKVHTLLLEDLLDQCDNSGHAHSSTFSRKLTLSNGHYHISSYLVSSNTLIINGNCGTQFHIGHTHHTRTLPSIIQNGDTKDLEEIADVMFIFSNSTVSLSHILFDCSPMRARIGSLDSSCVTIRASKILSNLECSPFAIGSGGKGSENSLLIIGCSHISSHSPCLLPFASGAGSLSSPSIGQPASSALKSVYISGSGLSFANTDLVRGSGPLFDFGQVKSDNADLSSISTTLSASLLPNTTSPSPSHHSPSRGCGGWCQRVCGCSVRKSSNHLSGTTINDMNSGGSLLCHNTSFAQCHPPSRSAPNPADPDTDSRVSQHFTKNTPIINRSITNHVFILCTFTDFPKNNSIFVDRIDINLRIDRCSFQRGNGHWEGCVYWYMQDRNPNEFSLSASSFVDQSTDGNGGSVFLWKVNIITIADCTFVNSSAKSIAGAVYVDRGAKNEVHLARCLFHKCRQTGPLGDEIGDFYERWLVGSRMLIGERIEQSDGG